MSRLILLTGSGGSGTSTLAAASVAALREEGLSACLVDGTRVSADSDAVDLVRSATGRLFGALGADAIATEAWVALPGLAPLSALLEARRRSWDVDAVVLDAGDLTRARDLVQVPGVLERLLDGLLTPSLAMSRSSSGDDLAFEALSEARHTIIALSRMLHSATTTARIVTLPTMDGVRRAGEAMATLSTLGLRVDGVTVNRFPRRSESSTDDLARASEAWDAMVAASEGVTVWKSTSRLRAVPKKLSVMGPLGGTLVLDGEALAVRAGDEDYRLDLPLARWAREKAQVGVSGDDLVIGLEGAYRWLPLPPILRRCRPIDAIRTEQGITVVFQPDPDAWMTRRGER